MQIDHIVSLYHGGSNDSANLQTLCQQCNVLKGRRRINFRGPRTSLSRGPEASPDVRGPASADAANVDAWERFLRRTLNFFYQCAAVGKVTIGGRGDSYYNWTVTLRSDNSPAWFEPHLAELFRRVQATREAGGKPRIVSLRIAAPGQKDVVVSESTGPTQQR